MIAQTQNKASGPERTSAHMEVEVREVDLTWPK